MATIWLAHIESYNPDTNAVETHYFSSHMYITGTTNLPPGGVAHTYYEPRIQQPALLRQEMFTSRKTYGKSQASFGLLELVNSDGGIDYLGNYYFDNRRITIILGKVSPGEVPIWSVILDGIMQQIELSWEKVIFPLYDKQKRFEKKILIHEYAGTNALPAGLEGVIEDLKGKPKPRLFGVVSQISPPLVNTAKLIYQVNDGAIYDVTNAYDSGNALTKGANYTSESDMFSNDPDPGYYRVWPAGGYLRLGLAVSNTFTCDVREKQYDADMSVAQIVKRIVTGDNILTSGEVNSTAVSAVDTINASVAGIYINTNTSYSDVLDALANSIRMFYYFDSSGILQMGIVDSTPGTSIATITQSDIIRFNRLPSNEENGGLPCYKVTVNYKKFWTTQTSNIADEVSEAFKSELAKEYRSVVVSNTAIQTGHPLATELSFDTLLIDEAAATDFANDVLTLYGVDNYFFEVRVILESETISVIKMGSTITIEHDRLGINGSKDLIVTAIKPNAQLQLYDLTLWGVI